MFQKQLEVVDGLGSLLGFLLTFSSSSSSSSDSSDSSDSWDLVERDGGGGSIWIDRLG